MGDDESDSLTEGSTERLSTKHFYGKKIQYMRPKFNPIVKVNRLPDSVFELYGKRSSSSAVDSNGHKVPTRSNEEKVFLGSQSIRHKVKRSKKTAHHVRRYRQPHQADAASPNDIDSMKSGDLSETGSVISISTEDEERNEKIVLRDSELPAKKENSRRRKASAIGAAKIAKFYKIVTPVDDDEFPSGERRRIPKRQASAGVAKKIAMAYDSSSEDEYRFISKIKFYKGRKNEDSSDFSSNESNYTSSNYSGYSRAKTSKTKKIQRPPTPKISDYEKSAKEKVALRMKFLKSLKGNSSDEDI